MFTKGFNIELGWRKKEIEQSSSEALLIEFFVISIVIRCKDSNKNTIMCFTHVVFFFHHHFNFCAPWWNVPTWLLTMVLWLPLIILKSWTQNVMFPTFFIFSIRKKWRHENLNSLFKSKTSDNTIKLNQSKRMPKGKHGKHAFFPNRHSKLWVFPQVLYPPP